MWFDTSVLCVKLYCIGGVVSCDVTVSNVIVKVCLDKVVEGQGNILVPLQSGRVYVDGYDMFIYGRSFV